MNRKNGAAARRGRSAAASTHFVAASERSPALIEDAAEIRLAG
jgi:hypothetical protein